jgi:hypothetical protein
MKKKLNNNHFSFHKTDFVNTVTYARCKEAFNRSAVLCAAYFTNHSLPSTARCQHCLEIKVCFKVQYVQSTALSLSNTVFIPPPLFLHGYNETEDSIKYKSKYVTLEYSNILQTSVKQERLEWKQYVITLQH